MDPTSSSSLSDDQHWMKLAIEQATLAGDDVPVGCVIVHDGKIIASGYNQREASGDPTAHAEVLAMRQAAQVLGGWRLNGCTIYSTLEPCAMCAEALIQARVTRLVYGAYDAASGAAGSIFNLFVLGRIYPIPATLGGICEQECKDLLVNFFRNRQSK